MFGRVCRTSAIAALLLASALGQGADAAEPHRVFSVLELESVDDIATLGADSFIAVSSAEDGVVRVNGLGTVTRVAGTGRFGFSGDGGAADRARLWSPTDVSPTPDGGFLVADSSNCRIRRVTPSGTIHTAAGSGPRDGCSGLPGESFGGDGGPATSARLDEPQAVSSLTDGGFLLSDTDNDRVRRVDAHGTITTVAGSGPITPPTESRDPHADPGYGGQATAARLMRPIGLAALADGGFLVQDSHIPSLHHVGADGIIRPAVVGTSRSPALSEDGSLWFRGRRNAVLWRYPDGSIRRIAGGRRAGYFSGHGDPALSTAFEELGDLDFFDTAPIDVEPTADGGFLVLTEERVLFVAPPDTQRLAVAVARESLPGLLRRSFRFRTTLAARVTLRLRAGRTAFRRRIAARKGLNSIRLPRRLKPGVYMASLRARAANGASATDSLPVLVGPRLPVDVAVSAIAEHFPTGTVDEPPYDTVRGCRRFGPRRVDCTIVTWDPDELEVLRCIRAVTALLRRTGYVYLRPYRCGPPRGRFTAKPRWTRAAVQAPPLFER